VDGVLPFTRAILLHFDAVGCELLVFCGVVVLFTAFGAYQFDQVAHMYPSKRTKTVYQNRFSFSIILNVFLTKSDTDAKCGQHEIMKGPLSLPVSLEHTGVFKDACEHFADLKKQIVLGERPVLAFEYAKPVLMDRELSGK
jgi:hypothetical protein